MQWELDVPERAMTGLFNLICNFLSFVTVTDHTATTRLDKDKATNFYPHTTQANTYL